MKQTTDSPTPGSRPPAPEAGFALLLVFLMAAVVAITLYSEIPRVAFQAQRQKEQLLIERGEQYQRAIQLFVRANNRYPSKLEDLENVNNRRFLRHKFKDPMTGKDEWRLIHVNVAGVFTDSIANKKKAQPDTQASQNIFVGTEAYLAPDPSPQAQPGPTAATRRRQSEGGAAPVDANGQPLIPPPNPQAQNFQEGAAPPPFPQPGVPGQPGPPGQPQDPNSPQFANQQQPNQPFVQGNPSQPAPGGVAGNPGFGGGNPNAPIGGAIAGVASTSEAPAIMVYNDHTNYNEWEFIFDISKQKVRVNPGIPAATIGTVPGGAPGIPGGTAGQPGGATQTASPFFISGAPVQQQSPIPSWFRFGVP